MSRVRKIANPSMTGDLTGKERRAGGLRLIEVRWDTGAISYVPESQVEAIEVFTPWQPLDHPVISRLSKQRTGSNSTGATACSGMK